jgi:7-carboxy-7-deazaguanine synthase
MKTLRINEIFYSIQGEASHQGLPCVFVRLGGCELRCTYCDTKYAYHQHEEMGFESIFEQIRVHSPCKLVQVTGGEPLEQENVIPFMEALLEKNYTVLLETGGHCSIEKVPQEVVKVLDLKTPASGEEHRNLWSNLDFMKAHDEIKFVICDKGDFEWARDKIDQKLSGFPGQIWMSPMTPGLSSKDLSEWVLDSGLENIRLQVQLHKMIWGSRRGH